MRKKFRLPKAASIFTAKACAILEAFHHIQSNNIQSPIIFTDSMSVIRPIENINSKTKHNINKDIIIAWVPSHQGIKGEEADIAAKEATSPASNVIRRRIPYQDYVVSLYHAEKQSWNKIWNTSKKTKTHEII
ncbi:hypothetical protein QLX08_009224 [Tetragonisca angustula]|uniref:RNase H type-1 domain-containing protein n=1 Tax=Tetragonisca angustula TaxID=166442 RepID=A0AAW0ZH06_9HYME